jgi:hypothetical protein
MLPNIPRLPEYGPWMPYASAAALCGSAGQVLMTAGMKRGRAGTSALGNYTAVRRRDLLATASGVDLSCADRLFTQPSSSTWRTARSRQLLKC